MKSEYIGDSLADLVKCMSDCMQKAIEEEPEAAKSWTPEQLFEKGAGWAGRNVKITESK